MPRPIVHYTTDRVPVTLLLTRRNDETRPDRAEAAQYQTVFERLLNDFAPDQLIACNAHPMIQAVMTYKTTRLPTEEEVQPWFDAVCAVWDDAALYQSMASRARQIAAERYSEAVSRRNHVEYFVALRPGARHITTDDEA